MIKKQKYRHFCLQVIFAVSITVNLSLPGSVFAVAILDTVSQINNQDKTRLFLRFSELPLWEREDSSRRLSLTFHETIPGEGMKILSGDERMVKMVSRKHLNNLHTSFYFRYPPQKITVQEKKESNTLIIDILPGSPLITRHPELARLGGITILRRPEIDFTNPVHISRYGDNWRLFIKEYESEVKIEPGIIPTMPPFPFAAHMPPPLSVDKWLPEPVRQLCKENKWQQAAADIRQLLETEPDEDKRNRLLLTYAETLVRSGNYNEPDRLLRKILLNRPAPAIEKLTRLLYAYTAVFNKDPHLARMELIKSKTQFKTDSSLMPYLNIFQAELALMTAQIEEASEILQRDNVAYAGRVGIMRLLRQADVYYSSGNTAKALVAYRKLEKQQQGAINNCPASLSKFSNALYIYSLYEEAAIHYQQLVNQTINSPWQPLAMFRLAMSRINANDKMIRIRPLLARIQTAFTDSEGGYRAALKENDLQFLEGRIKNDEAIKNYGQLGETAPTASLREEAFIKQAMVNALAGNHEASVRQAMAVVRDFRKGQLLTEARTLIITQLPDLLTWMIKEKRFVNALVLAKQNRIFFSRGWLDIGMLHDLAIAYTEMGLHERAIQTYLYLLNVAGKEERERAFLPMLRALYKNSSYAMLEDYADQYYLNHGATENYREIFLLRLKALEQMNISNIDHMVRLLDNPARPSSPEINRLAARIYFEAHRWDEVITILDKIKESPLLTGKDNNNDQKLTSAQKNMLGEALFQTGKFDQAEKVLSYFNTDETWQDQVLFRLAEISLKQGNKDKALKRFEKITEKGKSPRWKKMASERIRIIGLNAKM